MLAVWQASIVDDAGNVQGGASVEVRLDTEGAPLANLYEDRDGTVPLGNPVTADNETGFVRFYVTGGAYRITATKGEFSKVWRHVAIGLGAETDNITFGIRQRFSEENTDGDLPSGVFRFNTDTLGNVDTVYLSNENDAGLDISAWIDTWDGFGESANRGQLIIQQNDAGAFIIATFTGDVSPGGDSDDVGFRELSLSVVNSGGEFTDGALCSILFIPKGTDGEDGEDGTNGEVAVSGSPSAGQYARWTNGTTIEGRTASQAFGDIKQTATEASTGVLDKATNGEIRGSVAGAHAICAEDLESAAAAASSLSESGGSIAIDWDNFIWDGEVEVDENFTIENPTNGKPGQHRQFIVRGNNSTERTGSVGNQFGGEIPDIVVTDTDKILVTIFCRTSSQFLIWANDATDA